METRNLSVTQTVQFYQFTRYNVHILGPLLEEEVKTNQKWIDSNVDNLNLAWQKTCEQVSSYYLFYKRDQKLAEKYINLLLSILPKGSNGSKEQAEYQRIQSWLGHAGTINGGYHDTSLFHLSDDLLKQTRPVTVDAATEDEIFSLKYYALMVYRKSYLLLEPGDKRAFMPEYMDQAVALMQYALELASMHSNPEVLIDVAECAHILGAMYIKQNNLKSAEAALAQAIEFEKTFNEKTQSTHFLLFTSMQTLGDIKRRLKKYDESIELLREAEAGQRTYFRTTDHADIAKTHDFLANSLFENGKIGSAFYYFMEALRVKSNATILPGGIQSPIYKVTRDAAIKLIAENPNILANHFIDLPSILQNLITSLNSDFFDFNNQMTYAFSERKYKDIEKLLFALDNANSLKMAINTSEFASSAERLHLKMGEIYTHLRVKPENNSSPLDVALIHLTKASASLNSQISHWANNHIAFVYQQKLAQASAALRREKSTKEPLSANIASLETEIAHYKAEAYRHCEIVLSATKTATLDQPEQIKLYAYAACVQALTQYEEGSLDLAITNYALALDLYEQIGAIDDQCIRAKNHWAMMLSEKSLLLEKAGEQDNAMRFKADAKKALDSIAKYWFKTSDTNAFFSDERQFDAWHQKNNSVFPARFLKTQADFLSTNDPLQAMKRYEATAKILEKTDATNTGFIQDMYKKASEMSEILVTNEQKAMTITQNRKDQMLQELLSKRDVILSKFYGKFFNNTVGSFTTKLEIEQTNGVKLK